MIHAIDAPVGRPELIRETESGSVHTGGSFLAAKRECHGSVADPVTIPKQHPESRTAGQNAREVRYVSPHMCPLCVPVARMSVTGLSVARKPTRVDHRPSIST
jgi:hypothetical protein